MPGLQTLARSRLEAMCAHVGVHMLWELELAGAETFSLKQAPGLKVRSFWASRAGPRGGHVGRVDLQGTVQQPSE